MRLAVAIGFVAVVSAACGTGVSSALPPDASASSSPGNSRESGASSGGASDGDPATVGSSDGDASTPRDGATSAEQSPFPSEAFLVDDAGPECWANVDGPVIGESGPCTTLLQETCGQTTYYATCACPQGTCGCVGPTTLVVDFTGCPYCPGEVDVPPGDFDAAEAIVKDAGAYKGARAAARQVFALCGFPY
jgi:hypothetical protein